MKHAIAIDIGGTAIKYALVTETGDIVKESKAVSKEGSFSETLKTIILDLINDSKAANLNLVGIGIGVPSIVDDSVVLFANNFPDLNNRNIKKMVAEYTSLPVWVDNDANLMGLGEIRYGKFQNLSDVVFLTIGTGIGGALFINGQLYGGYRNRGTELGHFIINFEGKPCSCGTNGCLEAYASVTALIEDYKMASGDYSERIDGKYIIDRYMEGDENAATVMNNHFKYMAIGIAGLINIFAPQKVIVGGGITESGDFYMENIRELLPQFVMRETSEFTTIDRASLGNKAGFLGAAAAVFGNGE